MVVFAQIKNGGTSNDISLSTDGEQKEIRIAAKPQGGGSSVNGGELLMLALATCFCNDVYREAAKRNLQVDAVDVTCSAEFKREGEGCSDILYSVKVSSGESPQAIADLIAHVDAIAEIHNTIRKSANVTLSSPFAG
jgi:organic hydroperoxide reductase OsmC/OhrA